MDQHSLHLENGSLMNRKSKLINFYFKFNYNFRDYKSLQRLHRDCLRKNKGLTVQLGDDAEVALVPINYKSDIKNLII